MKNQRMLRPTGEEIVLGNTSYRLKKGSFRGYTITYPAVVPGAGVWENVLVRELFPLEAHMVREENEILFIPESDREAFRQARKVMIKAQRLEQRWLQPFRGESKAVDAYNTTYVVRTFPRAVTLKDALKEGPLPLEMALIIMDQMLQRVEEIHDAGLLHLHIAPERLYLLPDKRLILDYDCLYDKKNLSGSLGAQPGNCYGAPEVLLENLQEVGETADIYSCCAVLFKTLFVSQHRENNLLSSQFANSLCRDLASGRDQTSGLVPELTRILSCGLHILPHRRYRTAKELHMEVRGMIYNGS